MQRQDEPGHLQLVITVEPKLFKEMGNPLRNRIP